jgi:preprotein translocase subunit YajC
VSHVAVFAQESGGNPLGLIILLLPIAAIIFLTVVPQRRQRRQQAELMNAMDVGDEVVTIGGIHGVINHIEDDVLHIEVDDDVVVKFSKGAISRRVGDPDPSDPASRQRGGGILGSLMGGGSAPARSGAGGDADGAGGGSADASDADGSGEGVGGEGDADGGDGRSRG